MNNQWSDDYWLPLLQLYLKKPAGVKPLYSRGLVNLSIELHIKPQQLYSRMFSLRQHDTPTLQRLWENYAVRPQRLSRMVKKQRLMRGFGNENSFYDGVETRETFENDFQPVSADCELTPVMLIMILDLYFRLTPGTMVEETPEIADLARMLCVKPSTVVDVMMQFTIHDPCMHRPAPEPKPFTTACRDIWRRYGNEDPEQLAATAAQLAAYFK